ncbi:DUF3237 domain-containing protein [Parasphingopyxis marina]|uniref:UPF0311 protein H6P80_05530 n=1 Tax=Parasphingopyxis marina TaxID=2761622 RepID=A0A842HYT0_9SPHN|nr:DUF3237 domain-containing protein [Parasphingopyxis marina]MBC2777080.1 DUF3237 domain-containing protein [Parasphingopyxis marina]
MDDILSTLGNPHLEFAFECTLKFTRVQTIPDTPNGGMRSAVYVDEGHFEGPRLKGKAVPNSGGDYAYFRPDDTAVFDARYMLEEEDGSLILMRNRGYLWGREADTMDRLRHWAFEGGEPVAHADYYLRAQPSFETSAGKHDWLMKHVFIGVGERRADGNFVRYFALT